MATINELLIGIEGKGFFETESGDFPQFCQFCGDEFDEADPVTDADVRCNGWEVGICEICHYTLSEAAKVGNIAHFEYLIGMEVVIDFEGKELINV